MPPEKIDSLPDDVKPLVLGLLNQISELTARVEELLAENKALRARIAELEAKSGKPPKTPDNSSLPPSRGQKGNVANPAKGKKTRKGRPGTARALAENPDATRDIYAERWRAAPRSKRQARNSRGPGTMSICRRSSRSQHGSICSARRARAAKSASPPGRRPTCPRARRSVPA
jgi:hypothetical protein